MILDKRKKIESGWDSAKRRMIKNKGRKSWGKLDDCYWLSASRQGSVAKCSAQPDKKVYYFKGHGLRYRRFNSKCTWINSWGKVERRGRWRAVTTTSTVFLLWLCLCNGAWHAGVPSHALHTFVWCSLVSIVTPRQRDVVLVDNWHVQCVSPHCTFAPVFIIFVSLQQCYINSPFAGALMLGGRRHPCWGDLCSSSSFASQYFSKEQKGPSHMPFITDHVRKLCALRSFASQIFYGSYMSIRQGSLHFFTWVLVTAC